MVEIDVCDPTLYRDGFPHECFAELRRDGPIHRHRSVVVTESLNDETQEFGFWCVVGHPEIQQINRDWETFTAESGPTLVRSERGSAGLLGLDPPEHHRLRRLVSAGFTPRMIGRLENRIEHWTDRLIEDLDPAATEFVEQLAYPLPMHVIAEIIGIPESDRPWVFAHTNIVLRGLGGADEDGTSTASAAELFDYAMKLGAEKRAHPTDDVWSLIINASYPDEDGAAAQLESFEVDTFFLILSIAGSETTRGALAGGMLAFTERPAEFRRLRDDPATRATMPDEVLRFTSPVIAFGRDATADIEVAGTTIEAGERVLMVHPSGNRDERVYDDPHRFDIGRDPNPHLAFGGGGPHFCLGANLAKREIKVVFERLVDRFDDVEQSGPVEWVGPGLRSNVGCSVAELPVALA